MDACGHLLRRQSRGQGRAPVAGALAGALRGRNLFHRDDKGDEHRGDRIRPAFYDDRGVRRFPGSPRSADLGFGLARRACR